MAPHEEPHRHAFVPTKPGGLGTILESLTPSHNILQLQIQVARVFGFL
jgi:hypothetical protein